MPEKTYAIGDVVFERYLITGAGTFDGIDTRYPCAGIDGARCTLSVGPCAEKYEQAFIEQLAAWKRLDHIGIPKPILYEVGDGALSVLIDQPLCAMQPLGALSGLFCPAQGGAAEHADITPARILLQSADILAALAEAGFVHGDIKPDNLLFDGRRLWLTEYLLLPGGYTPAYCSMEQMDGGPLTYKTDVYSWAVSVMELYIGERPWANGVVAGLNAEAYLAQVSHWPEGLPALLRACLHREPEKRPDWPEILTRLRRIFADERPDSPDAAKTVFDPGATVYEGADTEPDPAVTQFDDGSITAAALSDAADRSDASDSNPSIRKGDTLLDAYTVESDAISGGMGAVWRVHHTGWNTDLAMKRPQPQCFTTENSKVRFSHECEQWINLGLHPNIVSCYYVREIGGVPSIFSEWMDGGSLEGAIKDGTLYEGAEAEQQERLLDIAIQFARGLRYAHDAGLIHQDVKPDNLLLTKEGNAKVADFGLANARAALTQLEGNPAVREVADSGKTMFSPSGGYTPAYCSMEQMDGKVLTRRTDIYSWAVSVMELYVGARPWANGVVAGLTCRGYFADTRVPIPEALQDLLAKCMETEPDDRPHDFAEIETALQEIYRAETGAPYPRPAPKAAADTADSLNNRALSFLDLGKTDAAERCWERALKEDPSHLLSTYNRGLFRWRRGEADDLAVLDAVRARERGEALSSLLEAERAVRELGRCDNDALPNTSVNGMRSSHDGKTLILMDGNPQGSPQCRLLDIASMRPTACLYSRTLDGYINGAAFTPDDRYVVTAGSDGLAMRWDVQTGKPVDAYASAQHPLYPEQRLEIFAVDTLPDGAGLVFADDGGGLTIMGFGQGADASRIPTDSSRLKDVQVSADGKLLAACGAHAAYLWELKSERLLAAVRDDDEILAAVRLTPDNATLVTGGADGTIRFWRVEDGVCTRTVRPTEQHAGVESLDISADGTLLLVHNQGDRDCARLYDISTGRCLRTYASQRDSARAISSSTVRAACFAADGRSVFVASYTEGVVCYTLPKGTKAEYRLSKVSAAAQVSKEQRAFFEHFEHAKAAQVAGDTAAALAALTAARGVGAYQNAPQCVALNFELSKHCEITGVRNIVPVCMLPVPDRDGPPAVLAGSDIFETWDIPYVRYWRWSTGEQLGSVYIADSSAFFHAAVHPGARLAAYGRDDGGVCLKMIDTGREYDLPDPHRRSYGSDDCKSGGIQSLIFSPDGQWLYTGNDEGEIDLWSVRDKRFVKTLLTVEWSDLGLGIGADPELALSPDGNTLLIMAEREVLFLDLDSGRVRTRLPLGRFATNFFYAAMDPTGTWALTWDSSRTVTLWDAVFGVQIADLGSSDERFTAFTADGRFVMIGLRLWDLQRAACIYDMSASGQALKRARISPDGGSVLTCGESGTDYQLWRVDYALRAPR